MQEPDLGPAGTRLWTATTDRYDLNDIEREMLASAAGMADMIDRLEEMLRDSLETVGAAGQPKFSPAVAELRQARLALSRLLVDLALPPDADGDVKAPAPPVAGSFNSRRASAAVTVRHNRARLAAARREKGAANGAAANA